MLSEPSQLQRVPSFGYLSTQFIFKGPMDQSPHHPSFVLLLPLMIMATSLSILITCSCLTLAVALAAHVPGNETDRLALLAFKDAITSDPLSSLRNWNSTVHPCRWLGVTCGLRHGRVVALDLRGRSLVGTISPHVGNLSFLRVLSLRNNSFTGVIPEEVGRLTRLAHLDVKNNSNIGGGIPPNLSRCTRLGLLDLYGNQLVGNIPVELGSLSQLTELHLGANNLHGSIPPSLGNLSSLVRLSLLKNNLEGSIPDDLGRLTRLGFFQVATNNLSGPIPPSLYNLSAIYYFAATDNRLRGSLPSNLGLALPRLEALGLGGNQFSGAIPNSLANASRLKIVDLPMNNFRGPVPESLGTLRGLSRLNLAQNPLGGSNTTRGDDLSFVTSMTNCSSLQGLGVEFCQLEGPLPKSVANFSTRLTVLALGGNRISGSIPMGIGNLVGLIGLAMNVNVLEGAIPSTMGNLRQLQVLLLSKNRISGKIPAALGNLSSLSWLDLQENGLEGDIPGSLGECRHLQLLDLSHNSLEGEIPRQLFGLSSLSISLNLAYNSLSGPLPIEVGSLQNLGELVVSHNGLAGTIPTTLGGCTRLESLYMNENSFEGGIPSSLGNLKIIQQLDLSHNNLTGQIPASLGSLPYLAYLNLSYNDLQGRVPKDGVFANSSAISLLGNSRLCGGIPLLEFPTCPTQLMTNGRGKLDRVKVTILIPCLVLFSAASTAILFTLWMRKKSRRKPSPVLSCEEDEHRRVSYAELFRATDGFSPSNLLGVGSYGSVYKGQLDHDQEPVAVKVLNLQQRGALESFLTECKALRSVRHRNLVKVITLCSAVDTKGDDFKALVFEFMSNGTLDEWLHSEIIMETLQHPPKRLDLLKRLDIAIHVASALLYLHQLHGPTPIVHCDVKPSNVLLDDNMTAHVGDFGLVRFLSKSMSTDAVGAQSSSMGLKGTIGYIPPEYGMGKEPSREGDIYSYGILLLEMFTGRRPTDCIFEGNLNLRKLVESAFPWRVMDIADPSLLMLAETTDHGIVSATGDVMGSEQNVVRRMVEDCLVHVIGIGLSCCAELPQERRTIEDIVVELLKVRETFPKRP